MFPISESERLTSRRKARRETLSVPTLSVCIYTVQVFEGSSEKSHWRNSVRMRHVWKAVYSFVQYAEAQEGDSCLGDISSILELVNEYPVSSIVAFALLLFCPGGTAVIVTKKAKRHFCGDLMYRFNCSLFCCSVFNRSVISVRVFNLLSISHPTPFQCDWCGKQFTEPS
ncbi:unnamed protein product, partial [Cyprideis torosa]